MNNKMKKLLKDTIIFAIGSIGSKMILFFLVPLYTNYLTTEQYGIADLIFTVSELIIPFMSIAIYNGVLRYGLSKNIKKEDVLLSSIIIITITSIIGSPLILLFGGFSSISKWKYYIAIYVVVSCYNLIFLNYLKVNNQNKHFAIASLIQTCVLCLFNIIFLVLLKVGIEGYLLSNIIALIISTIFVAHKGKIYDSLKKGRYSKELSKKIIIYSAPVVINDISWWIIHSSDKIMIEIMLNANILGLYTVATKMPALLNVFTTIFSKSWGISSINEIEKDNDINFYSLVFEYYSLFVFFISLLIISISKYFMIIYVSKDFYDSWKFVPILIASATFSAISTYFGAIYGALKKNMNAMITTLCAATINIICNYIFIICFGIWGAIIGTISAYLVISTIRMFDIKRFINLRINILNYLLNSILVLCLAIIVTIEYHSVILSIMILIIFIIINIKTIISLLKDENIGGIMEKLLYHLLKLFWIFPIKNSKIFLLCFDGTNIGYDAKEFVIWMNENKKINNIIWGCKSNKEVKNFKLENVTFVKIKSFKGIYNLLTSRVILYNINPPSFLPYRKKQILINTWHGYAYKKVGKYVKGYSKDRFNLATCFISHSDLYTKNVLLDSFEFEKDILNCGAPRNDVFFDKNKMSSRKKAVYDYYSIDYNKKIILFAPTFRGDFEQFKIELDYKRIMQSAMKCFKWNDCVFIYRFHPMIKIKEDINNDNIINGSTYPDMQDLLCASDILITDYSGCIWDFALSRKMAFLFATDLDLYLKDRGLYYDLRKLPFPIATNNNELINNILNFNNETYLNELEKYFKKNKTYDNGNSCKTIYNYFSEIIRKKEKKK